MDVRLANIANVTFAQPAAGMQVVMDNSCLGQAVALSDLLRQKFMVIRDLNPNDIRSRELTMIHVSKAMALHLLLGNLATNGVTNFHNKANAVNPSTFLPQRNLYLVKEQRSTDLNSCNKLGMDVLCEVYSTTALTLQLTLQPFLESGAFFSFQAPARF